MIIIIHIYIAHRFYSVQMENVQTLTIFNCSLSNKRYLHLSFIIVGIFMYYTDLHTLINLKLLYVNKWNQRETRLP